MFPIPVPVDLSPVEVSQLSVYDDQVHALDQGGLRTRARDGQWHHLALPSRGTAMGWHRGRFVVGTEHGAYARHGEHWEPLGPRERVVAVTSSTVVYQSGRMHPGGDLGVAVVDAVSFDDGLAIATRDGRLLLPDGELSLAWPASDLAVVDGHLRVAAYTEAWSISPWGDSRVLGIPATAAGAVWGLADGSLVSDEGERIAAVPGGVRSIVSHAEGLYVATAAGVHALSDSGLQTVTGVCGGFITGVAEWGEALLVGTFDRGACIHRAGVWTPIPDLPSPLINEVVVHQDAAWLATAGGLVRLEHDGSQTVYGRAPAFASVQEPGLHHFGANDLAVVGDTLWVADLFGPVEVRPDHTWRRWRLHVTGRSYQAVAACPDGSVWLASEDDGLAARGTTQGRQNGRSPWRHVNQADGLAQDWVMALACSPEGLWIGNYNRGVGRLVDGQWLPVDGLEEAWVQALAWWQDALWVGTADGLYVVRGDSVVRVGDQDVHELMPGTTSLWIGAVDGLWKVPTEVGVP